MQDFTERDFNAIVPEEPVQVHAKERCLPAEGYRQLADVLERVIAAGGSYYGDIVMVCATNAADFLTYARALGTFTKEADDQYFRCVRSFDGGVKLHVFIARNAVCKRVLLRVEDVPEQIIPATKREVYGWECGGSVLADKAPESVSAPVPELAAAGVQDSDIPF